MKVIVTGATGFIGQHLIRKLLQHGHQVTAVVRDLKRAKEFEWFEKIHYIQADLHSNYLPVIQSLAKADALIHLAWPGLPNFQDSFHIYRNLAADLSFLKSVVEKGLSQLVVSGTCLEYGLISGPLSEDMNTYPITPYGFAKDSLRKSLEFLQKENEFTLQWMRLFYMYGEGQSKNSLMSQLDYAINSQKPIFNMSAGNQIRDYLTVEEVAENFCLVLENPGIHGIINCCSGKPITIVELIEKKISEKGSKIILNRGHYSIPEYEPLEFWGVPDKLNSLKLGNK